MELLNITETAIEFVKKSTLQFTTRDLGIDVSNQSVLWAAVSALFLTVYFLCFLRCFAQILQNRKQARVRALIVNLAESPEDDHDDHELEQRGEVRAAAPGDSDMEDEPSLNKGGLVSCAPLAREQNEL